MFSKILISWLDVILVTSVLRFICPTVYKLFNCDSFLRKRIILSVRFNESLAYANDCENFSNNKISGRYLIFPLQLSHDHFLDLITTFLANCTEVTDTDFIIKIYFLMFFIYDIFERFRLNSTK